MARRDALLRLHKTLLARRAAIRKTLASELADLRKMSVDASGGDSADAAFDAGTDEIACQLAELEARELNQIERALHQLKQGTYGLCEHCQGKIALARLNALPYSTTCIDCQREMEGSGSWGLRRSEDWGKVIEHEAPLQESKEIDLSEIELDLTSNR